MATWKIRDVLDHINEMRSNDEITRLCAIKGAIQCAFYEYRQKKQNGMKYQKFEELFLFVLAHLEYNPTSFKGYYTREVVDEVIQYYIEKL